MVDTMDGLVLIRKGYMTDVCHTITTFTLKCMKKSVIYLLYHLDNTFSIVFMNITMVFKSVHTHYSLI